MPQVGSRRVRRRSCIAAAATAVVAIGAVGVANASVHNTKVAKKPAVTGVTTVAVYATAVAAIGGHGLRLGAVKPGQLAFHVDNWEAPAPGDVGLDDIAAAFPIVGGADHGVIHHTGGLSFTKGGKSLALTNYVINVQTRVVTATAYRNGHSLGSLRLFDLGASAPRVGCAVTAELNIDKAAAVALHKTFGTPYLTGIDFGTACVAPSPQTTVFLKRPAVPTFLGGVTIAPVSRSALGWAGAYNVATFPVVGKVSHGIINHRGGLSFSNGSSTLAVTNFVMNTHTRVLTASAALNGTGIGSVALFDLSYSTPFGPSFPGCSVHAELTLDAAAASAFASDLGVPGLTGADFGTACVVPGSSS
jgi:hypothetical protein